MTRNVCSGLARASTAGRPAVCRLAPMLFIIGLAISACTTTSGSEVALPPTQAGTTPNATASGTPVPGSPPQVGGDSASNNLNMQLFQRAAASGAPSGDLPLGPGDLIEISVVDLPEFSGRNVRVPRQGDINLPLVGNVPVIGRTAGDLEQDLRQRLQQKYMRDPQVSVFVKERQSQRISVLGAVKKGGLLELTGRLRLADALAMAEGLADDADHVVYLFRRGSPETVARVQGDPDQVVKASTSSSTPVPAGIMTTIDLEAVAKGNEELNVPLRAGDVIVVPRAGSFYVGGEVTHPGSFLLRGKTTVHQAILQAGGQTNVAALSDVRLYRTEANGQIRVTSLSLDKFEAGDASPEIQKNDVIVVGKSGIKSFLYGTYDFFRGFFGMSKGL